MCGIAGILAGSGEAGGVAEHAIRVMTAALAARGPDGEGFHVAPSVWLGHRRLSIIDVEGGAQPLYSEDRRVCTVVNGEIYNFVALREELSRAGHVFATGSDSEVVVHGWEEWGEGLLDRLEGMFALAIWDGRRLILARDRFGEKPLFWAPLPGGGLAFASELKALRHAPGFDAAIDGESLGQYLVHEYVPSPRSIVRGARKLEAGCYLVARPGGAAVVRRYWDLPVPAANAPRITSAEEASSLLLGELRRSVRERLVSDVPLGVFLSGGVDSSAVAVLASEVLGGKLDTFSIGFEGDASFDETAEARRVARAIGSRHHEDRLSPSVLLDLLPAIGALLDEPLGDGSIAPTHLLARFARRRVTVALGGDGGDELFAGYPTFQAEKLAPLLDRVPAPVVRAARAVASRLPVSHRYFSADFKIRQLLRGAGARGVARHQAWLGSFTHAEASALLHRDVAVEAARVAGDDRWDELMYFYAKGYLGDDVLTKVDRATMAVGLEARAPFLDRGVVALACRISPKLRVRGTTTKYILKRAFRGLLPDETLSRRKQGFAMPIGRWLRAELRPLLEETLSPSKIGDLFDAARVRRLVDEHLAGRADHRKPLWTLIAFQRWREAWRG